MYSLLHIYSLNNLRSLGRDRSGATSIENSLLGALIAVAVIAAVSELGAMAYQIFDLTAQSVEQAASGSGGGDGGGGGGGSGGNDNDQGQNDDDQGQNQQ